MPAYALDCPCSELSHTLGVLFYLVFRSTNLLFSSFRHPWRIKHEFMQGFCPTAQRMEVVSGHVTILTLADMRPHQPKWVREVFT